MTASETIEKISSVLADKKALDIKTYDLRAKTNALVDFTLAATATSPPHLKALAGAVHREMRTAGATAARTSGDHESAWIVLDYGDVMAHIFLADAREYYEIEKLWAPGKTAPNPKSAVPQ